MKGRLTMTDHAKNPRGPDDIRRYAEGLLAGKEIDFQDLSPEKIAQLSHELQVHQVELEIQNEELRRAQVDLAEARDRYADLYDHAPVAYITTDGDGTIVAANLTAAELLRVRRNEIVGSPLSDFVARQDQDTLYLHRREIHRHGYLQRCELTMIKANGETFPAQLDSVVSPDKDGEFDHSRTVITDVTERVHAEQAVAQMRHHQSLEVLAAGIAHDFNNLLTAVIGAHSLATMDLKAPEHLPLHLGVMGEGLDAIRDLVHQLLTLASPTPTDKLVIATKELVKKGCRLAHTAGNVEYDYDLPKDVWAVIANEPTVSRAIQNLLTNADEAMPSGGLIRITAHNEVVLPGQHPKLHAGRYVRISVADAGPGIPDAYLPRVFDPYFSTKQRGEQRGMGLGLAVCHAIVTEHGGAITIDSQVGTGTTFDVYLPAAEKRRPARTKTSGTTRLRGGTGRVLVMDDQELVRTATSRMLKKLGYTPVAACDGAEAIRAYREGLDSGQRFAAVLLDLTAPGGAGGKAAIKELLEIDPTVVALISSGFAQDPVMTSFAQFGFKGALPKPYDLAELDEALHAVLHGE